MKENTDARKKSCDTVTFMIVLAADLRSEVQDQLSGNPGTLLVHCSAGVGRYGYPVL